MPSVIEAVKAGFNLLQGLNKLKNHMEANKNDPKAAFDSAVAPMKEAFGSGKIGEMLKNADPKQMDACSAKATEVAQNLDKGNYLAAFNGVMGGSGLLSLAKDALTQAMNGPKADAAPSSPQAGAAAPAAPSPTATTPASPAPSAQAPAAAAPAVKPAIPTPTPQAGYDKGNDKKEKDPNEEAIKKGKKRLDNANDASAIFMAMALQLDAMAKEPASKIANWAKNAATAGASKVGQAASAVASKAGEAVDAVKEKYAQSAAGQKAILDKLSPDAAPTPTGGARRKAKGEEDGTEMKPVDPTPKGTPQPAAQKDASQQKTAAESTAAQPQQQKPETPTPQIQTPSLGGGGL